MSNEAALAHEIRRQANQYKSMVDLADSLDQLGSIKNATKEAESARVITEQALEMANAALNDACKERDATKAQTKQILADAKEKAASDAIETIDAAKAKAQTLISKAEIKAAAIDEASEAAQFAAAAQYEQIATEITSQRAALTELAEAATAKQAEVEALKAEFEAMRAKFLGN